MSAWHLAFFWPWGPGNLGDWASFLGGWPQTLEGVGALGAAWALLRKHNCHVRGCWRIGRHPVLGTPYITCTRHHPHAPRRPLTAQKIHAAHDAYVDALPADSPEAAAAAVLHPDHRG